MGKKLTYRGFFGTYEAPGDVTQGNKVSRTKRGDVDRRTKAGKLLEEWGRREDKAHEPILNRK